MFDRKVFEAEFKKAISKLAKSEKVSKDELRVLSRTILEATHETGDISFINALLAILSPMNRKTAKLFFVEFSGFTYDETTQRFVQKSKKKYEERHAACVAFLEDPLNNIWTWADRNIELEKKDFDVNKIGELFEQFVKKAAKENLTQKDVLKAIFQKGVELDTIVALMGEIYDVDVAQS